MCTDKVVSCHNSFPMLLQEKCIALSLQENNATEASASSSLMTFRVKKCGRVEAEKATNLWAGQCQSKVFFKIFSIVIYNMKMMKK